MLIYLYSISTINQDKFERISVGVKQNLGIFNNENNKSTDSTQKKSTDLDNELLVSLSQDVLFAEGSTKLTSTAKGYLKKLAITIKDKEVLLIIEGHADSSPIHSNQYESNWQLSASRAASVCAWLELNGVKSKYLKAVSYGPSRPKSCIKKQLDRRVEIFIKPLNVLK